MSAANMRMLLIFTTILAAVLATPSKILPPIINGQTIDISTVPYQVALLVEGRGHNCGGVIISSNWVVTAAHCVDFTTPEFVTFRAGSNYHVSGGQVVRASNFIIHPEYSIINFNNDIALVSLLDSFTFSETVNLVQLPYPGQDWADGEQAYVSGWGLLFAGSTSSSPDLQGLALPIIGQSQCRALFWSNAITDQMLCAGFVEGGRGVCFNDSGGPLTVNGTLAGIVSWSVGCALPGFPAVYAHVGAHRTFISEHTGI